VRRPIQTYVHRTLSPNQPCIGGLVLNDSLSILIPIHNAQSTLAKDVGRLLEVASELTTRFDVLILDDGSTDRTEEVACDLATQYSQVSYVRFPEQRGLASALRAGLSQTKGEFVSVCNTEHPVSWDNLSRLWTQRRSPQTMTQEEEADAPRWLKRLMQWGRSLQDNQAAEMSTFTIRLLHRDDVAAWNAIDAALGRPYSQRLRKRQAASHATSIPAPAGDQNRMDSARPTGGPVWANFTQSVQDFALGE